MYKVFEHIVEITPEEKTRLSDYLTGIFPLLTTRKSIKKALSRKEIFVDGNTGYSGDYVLEGQIIEHRKTIEEVPSSIFTLHVLFEDEYVIVANKPPGIKTSGQGSATIEKALIAYGNNSSQVDALLSPQLIHRLDRDTCGVLIAAKTKSALDHLSEQMTNKKISKEYIAIVEGNPDQRFIDLDIDNKSALTEIISTETLHTKDQTSLIRINLHTGRTHQIRKHLKAIGCPIVGDQIYNENGVSFGRGLFLQAIKIDFLHPFNNEIISVVSQPHKKFLKYINYE